MPAATSFQTPTPQLLDYCSAALRRIDRRVQQGTILEPESIEALEEALLSLIEANRHL